MKGCVRVSKHGVERCKSRRDLNQRESKSIVSDAYKCGMRVEDFSGKRKDYICLRQNLGCELVYYKRNIFVFRNDLCVTMYPAPSWFNANVRKTAKGEYIRNVYKYKKYNEDYGEEIGL